MSLGIFAVRGKHRERMGVNMIETVLEMELPVGEKLVIKRNRLQPTEGESIGRFSVLSGIHGDELEGQYVCYEIARRIREHPELLHGTVDIYPALNPLGLELAERTLPQYDMDMNRTFPGSEDGDGMDRVAAALVQELTGSDMCIDVHASDKLVREIPQVRLSEEFAQQLLPYAKLMNVDMIWMNATATVHESTLAHAMNMLQIPTLVVEMGLGMRINPVYGNQVVDGIFNLMHQMGIWEKEVGVTQLPVISTDGSVEFLRAEAAGVFIPQIAHNHYVQEGETIGEIVDALAGEKQQEIVAAKPGLVFTLREYPIVYKGALLARILTDIGGDERA